MASGFYTGQAILCPTCPDGKWSKKLSYTTVLYYLHITILICYGSKRTWLCVQKLAKLISFQINRPSQPICSSDLIHQKFTNCFKYPTTIKLPIIFYSHPPPHSVCPWQITCCGPSVRNTLGKRLLFHCSIFQRIGNNWQSKYKKLPKEHQN